MMAAKKPTYWITPGCQIEPQGRLVRLDPSGEAWVLRTTGEWDRKAELDRLATDPDSMETAKTTVQKAAARAEALGASQAVPGRRE